VSRTNQKKNLHHNKRILKEKNIEIMFAFSKLNQKERKRKRIVAKTVFLLQKKLDKDYFFPVTS
jgi:hypothetical protein